jgi:hypothetical protein
MPHHLVHMRRPGSFRWLAGGVCAVVVAGCASRSSRSEIAQVTHTFQSAIAHGDGKQACAQLTPTAAAAITREGSAYGAHTCEGTIVLVARGLSAAQKRLAGSALTSITIHGDTATVGVRGGAAPAQLTKVGGRWLISSAATGTAATAATGTNTTGAGTTTGGSAEVSAHSYIDAVCLAVTTFERNVVKRGSAITPQGLKTPVEGKAAVSRYMDAVLGDAERVVRALQAAGIPRVSGGAGVQSGILAAFNRVLTVVRGAAAGAAKLPTGNADAFQRGATQLGTVVSGAMNGISTGLSGLRSPGLAAAAAADPNCKS